MQPKDASLYGVNRSRNLNQGKEISSASTLSFSLQLSSLINASANDNASKPTSSKSTKRKQDIFTTHNRNTAKRAIRDLESDNAGVFEQKHSTNSESLDPAEWERSQRKMAQKARIYAAMKRGDIEDMDDKYAVDFDQKWADARDAGDEKLFDYEDDEENEEDDGEQVEYIDEFGRNRKGSRLAAERARLEIIRSKQEEETFAGRPAAPTNVIYGDTIQHQAFDLDGSLTGQMEDLVKKRDRSPTPEHFDSTKEVRTKGTGFFQFSADPEVRKQQMENLDKERAMTERARATRKNTLKAYRNKLQKRRELIWQMSAEKEAKEFLEDL